MMPCHYPRGWEGKILHRIRFVCEKSNSENRFVQLRLRTIFAGQNKWDDETGWTRGEFSFSRSRLEGSNLPVWEGAMQCKTLKGPCAAMFSEVLALRRLPVFQMGCTLSKREVCETTDE